MLTSLVIWVEPDWTRIWYSPAGAWVPSESRPSQWMDHLPEGRTPWYRARTFWPWRSRMQTSTGAGLSKSTTTLRRFPSFVVPVRRWGICRGGGGSGARGLERARGASALIVGMADTVIFNSGLGQRTQVR